MSHTHTHVGIPAFLPSFASCCWSRVHEHTRNSLTWSDRSCRWSAGVSDRGRGAYGCDTPGGSSESVNGEDGRGLAQSHRAGSSTPSHHSSSVALSAFNAQLGQGSACRPRGDQDQERQRGPMGSADFSHHTSSSNSPVNCKDASDCHLRSASLSSDDVRGLSQSQQTLSRSATLPYDDTPQRAQPQRGGGIRSRARPSSPGSEMVTLEQFLQESTLKSSPPQRVGSREDFMPEYFSRSPASPGPGGRDQATPTSYVAPTVHASNTQRPGQSVTPSSQASGRRPVTLSRTFSLASADLLRSDGPEGFHGNRSDGVVRRPGANGRERPLSARMASDRHGGLLNSPVHHSSSLTLQTDGCVERGRKEGLPSSSSVAMVSPVRAAPAAPLDPASEHGEERAGDKASERVRCDSAEGPKSTPASPDPNNDPQTVWYEYGCV